MTKLYVYEIPANDAIEKLPFYLTVSDYLRSYSEKVNHKSGAKKFAQALDRWDKAQKAATNTLLWNGKFADEPRFFLIPAGSHLATCFTWLTDDGTTIVVTPYEFPWLDYDNMQSMDFPIEPLDDVDLDDD